MPVRPYRAATAVTARAPSNRTHSAEAAGSSERRIIACSCTKSAGPRLSSPARARCRMSSARKSLAIDADGMGRVAASPLSAA